jgi:hypothetical protein
MVKLKKRSSSKKSDKASDLLINKRKVRTLKGKPVTIFRFTHSEASSAIKKVSKSRSKDPDDKPEFKVAKRFNEKMIQDREWEPVDPETRWKCIRCGWCCTHSWRVNLTWDEYDRLQDIIPITEIVVDKKTGMSQWTKKQGCHIPFSRSKINVFVMIPPPKSAPYGVTALTAVPHSHFQLRPMGIWSDQNFVMGLSMVKKSTLEKWLNTLKNGGKKLECLFDC